MAFDIETERLHRDWLLYQEAGGTMGFDQWLEMEIGGGGINGDEPPVEPPEEPEEPLEDEDAEDFSQQLAAAVAAYQQQIGEWGAAQTAEAQRLGARGIGKMSRMQQMALLAQGRTAGEIEQLTAGGMEAGARSMADLIKQINLQTQQQQAGAAQFGIGTMISAEELGVRERGMAQMGGQFQQSLAEQMRQFNLAQQQQAQQWGQQFGLGQQQLGLQEQQIKGGLWGDILGLAGTLGGAYLGGPGGAAVGKWAGETVGGWFG